MSARALFEATVGRSLLVRIWAHGVLLFAGVLTLVMVARHVMWEIDAASAMRARPYVAAAVAERVLLRVGDREALARELAAVETSTPLSISVYAAGGALIASSVEPPLPGPTAGERAARRATPSELHWASGRMVIAAGEAGAGAAWAVVTTPAPPSLPWHAVGLFLSALVLGFVFVAAPLTYAIAHPVERLGVLARKLGAGDLSVRADTDRHDELGDLGRSFNIMAGQLQQLRAAERQLLGDVSHELRTPLARMTVVLDLASTADGAKLRRYIGEIAADLAELQQLIDDIIVSTRLDRDPARWSEARPPLRRAHVRVDELVRASLTRFRARWPERRLDDHVAASAATVDVDPAMLRRALDNLLDNARKFSDDDRPIELRVTQATVEARPGVRIEVIDHGVGIDAEDHPRVFSPFYRADRSRTRSTGGVGLGLTLTRRIVEAHGGTVGFSSARDRGSCFWVALALVETPQVSEPEA